MVDPTILLYGDWLAALLEDVSQPKASQCCTGLGIQTKPLSHRSSLPIVKFTRKRTGSETLERRLTAPVVATMVAARSKTVTSQPAFRRATAVDTPPTLPPMITTFVGIVITSVAVQSCILESGVQAATKSKVSTRQSVDGDNNGFWTRCGRSSGQTYSHY